MHIPFRHSLTLPPLTCVLLTCGLLSQSPLVLADAQVNFSGTLVEQPPCEIVGNNGATIDVNFGNDMITRKVDGVMYKTQIQFGLQCDNALNNSLKLSLSGDPATFGTGLIKTTKTGLGIRLFNGDTQLTPGAEVKFQKGTVPELYAVPVAQDNTTLTGGSFTGTGNLVVDYQ